MEILTTSSFDANAAEKIVEISNDYFYGRAYSSAPRCAALMPFLCRSTKKWRKKRNQRLPPLETFSVPLFKANRGERHI